MEDVHRVLLSLVREGRKRLYKSYRNPCQMLMSAVYGQHWKSPPPLLSNVHLFFLFFKPRSIVDTESLLCFLSMPSNKLRRQTGWLVVAIIWRWAIYRMQTPTLKSPPPPFFFHCLFNGRMSLSRIVPSRSITALRNIRRQNIAQVTQKRIQTTKLPI